MNVRISAKKRGTDVQDGLGLMNINMIMIFLIMRNMVVVLFSLWLQLILTTIPTITTALDFVKV